MLITSNYIFDTRTKSTFAGFVQIEGKRITRVGLMEEIPEDKKRIDYGDNMIIPGFIDAHVHLYLSVLLFNKNLSYVSGLSEKEVADQVPRLDVVNGWKIGIGWYSSEFGQNVYPTRKSIDHICPDIPVLLISGDAHTIWMNSKALEVMNIKMETVPKDVSGEALADTEGLTGVFLEAVAIHYLAQILEPFQENFTKEFHSYCQHLNKMGITAVGDVALTGEAKDDLVYPALYETAQEDTSLRINFFPAMREETLQIEQTAKKYHSELLNFGGVKQFFDGVTSTHTAFMKEEYAHPYFSGDAGAPLIAVEKMRCLILKANKKGWPIRIHTIGDQAIRLGLEYYQESQMLYPLPEGKYNTLEHLEVMDWNDMHLVQQDQLVISVQPSHLLVGWEALDAEVGAVRAKQMFPFHGFLKEGATLGFGTDSPVVVDVTPLDSIYYAVARKDIGGNPSHGLMKDQRIPILEALYAHTKGAAMAVSRNDIGSLEAGMLADICVLDHNILEDTIDQLLQTKVIATYFNGILLDFK